LWKTNKDAQYILDAYVVASYCTSYLAKINKNLIQEMEIILNKCKHEQTKTFECIKSLGNAF
jgi:hypothetical protein